LKFASDTGEIVPDSTQAQSIVAKTPASPPATARACIVCLAPLTDRILTSDFVNRNLPQPDAKAVFRKASPNVLHKNPICDGATLTRATLVTLASTTYTPR
jgi:hypothetical protein